MDEGRHYSELDLAERAAGERLAPVLRAFAPAYGATDELLRSLGSTFEGTPSDPAATTQALLTARLADELRSFWLLRSRGHSLSTWAIAATALEVAATSGHIAFDQVRARHWLSWSEVRSTPWAVAKMIDGAIANAKGSHDEGVDEGLANLVHHLVRREARQSDAPGPCIRSPVTGRPGSGRRPRC